MSPKRHLEAETLFLETEDAARIIKLKPRTLEKKRIDGSGPPFVKFGHQKVLYEYADLIAWVRAHKRTSTSDKGGAA